MRPDIRHFAGVTTGLTFVLVLLGLYTGATGGGLSCGTRWPLCNGWLGLFPANWASFFEWFHRLVAMVVGFLLLGLVYGVWRRTDDRRARHATTAAVALLPVQVLLGGVTTTAGGMFPGGFNPVVMFAHFTTATVIFALLVYATVRLYGTPAADRVRRVATAAVGLVALAALFEVVGPFAYEPANQTGYYAASFALLAVLVALLAWSQRAVEAASLPRFRAVTAAAAVALYADMVLSRHLFGFGPLVGELVALALVTLVGGVALVANRAVAAAGRVPSQRAD